MADMPGEETLPTGPVPSSEEERDDEEIRHYLKAANGARIEENPALRCIPVAVAVLVAAVMLRFIGPGSSNPKLWTREELAKHDGSSKQHAICLSILGSVFDVSKGSEHYGPGGSYHYFAGRDGSRAFVTGDFTGGLSDSVEGLSPSQIKSIDDWRNFYHKNYRYVGRLIGKYYDSDGKPSLDLLGVEKQAAVGAEIAKHQKADEELYVNCNSLWSSEDGSQVWCQSGYPRKVQKTAQGPYKGTVSKRCACFQDAELGRPGLELYEGCHSLATSCRVS